MSQSRRRCIGLCVVASIALATVVARDSLAQSGAREQAANAASSPFLDKWLVLRYRDAQLLGDNSVAERNVVDAPLPRVEHVHDARGDTLVGILFTADVARPALKLGGAARLAVPSGAITNVVGRVVAQRMFRAPRVPGARAEDAGSWRYGWAFVVVLPGRRDALPAKATRGWLLIDSAHAAGTPRSGGR